MVGSSDMYRERILDHYRNPRNYGELEDPTVSHVGENPMCGDEIRIDLRLCEEEERIDAIRFSGEGCAISQAAASILTRELEGEGISKLVEMDRDDMLEMLGVDMSPMRVKCAVLAEKVAQDAYEIHTGTDRDIDPTTTE